MFNKIIKTICITIGISHIAIGADDTKMSPLPPPPSLSRAINLLPPPPSLSRVSNESLAISSKQRPIKPSAQDIFIEAPLPTQKSTHSKIKKLIEFWSDTEKAKKS